MFLPYVVGVNKVVCKSQFGKCSDNITVEINQVGLDNYRQTKKKLKSVLASDIFVRSYAIGFSLPGTVEVNIIERKPKYALLARQKDKYAVLDDEGFVLLILEESNLPSVIGDMRNVGESVSPKELFALEIVFDMFGLYGVKSGEMVGESLVLEAKEKRIVFPIEGDKDKLIGTARLVLDDGQYDEFREIDLRFKNPVLKE